MRGRYLHLAYLLGAQTRVKTWRDAEATLHKLTPLAGVVASQRAVVLLRKSLPPLREPDVPVSTHEAAERLQLALA